MSEALPSTGNSTAWLATAVTCTGATGAVVTLAPPSVDITLGPGEDVTCTFYNKIASLSIDKTSTVTSVTAAGLVDEEFVDRATTGFEAYKATVEPYTLEYAQRETGVPADAIRDTAHAYATANRAMICWTLGITEHHNAWTTCWPSSTCRC